MYEFLVFYLKEQNMKPYGSKYLLGKDTLPFTPQIVPFQCLSSSGSLDPYGNDENPGVSGIWYTRVSGIWQSVWLESVAWHPAKTGEIPNES